MKAPAAADPFSRTSISVAVGGRRVGLETAHDLFSSHELDAGTGLLLRSLEQAGGARSVLDVGCGYGALGLGAKTLDPARRVLMLDRDALAVAYARRNAAGLEGVEVRPGLGYDEVAGERFDLILSNLPAKAGEPVLVELLRGAATVLSPQGLAAVVVVAPLASFVARTLERARAQVTFHRETKRYSVFHYQLEPRPPEPADALARGVYDRGSLEIRRHGATVVTRTAHGLPEFDTVSEETALTIDLLASLPQRAVASVLMFRTGQGHTACFAWRRFEPERLEVCERDLLALRYTAANLARNGCPAERLHLVHAVEPEGSRADLVVCRLRHKEPPAASLAHVARAAERMRAGGRLVVAGTSTLVTRAEAALAGEPFRLVAARRLRKHGHSAAMFTAAEAPPARRGRGRR